MQKLFTNPSDHVCLLQALSDLECLHEPKMLGRVLGLETSYLYTFTLSHAMPFVSSVDCMKVDAKFGYASVPTEIRQMDGATKQRWFTWCILLC